MATTYAIPNGRTVMDATTYTATGTTQTITNNDNGTTGFKPDLVWIKPRSNTSVHYLMDSNRGTSKNISSNSISAEATDSNYLTSFNSNGWSMGSSNTTNGWTVVGWQWQAGQGTNTTNTSGSITSTVSVNQTAGFSIVTYTGTGASGTVGHGLGAAPKLIIYKSRSTAHNWLVNVGAITGTQGDYLYLNATDAKANSSNVLNGNSTTFGLVTSPENNESGTTFVAYCWASVDGFSQFGSYTGNNSADGPFIYLGFRPKYFMIKRTDSSAGQWDIADSSRDPYNTVNNWLYANAIDAEAAVGSLYDFVSNGVKIRTTGSGVNASGGTYIYAAFAENPFKYANAR